MGNLTEKEVCEYVRGRLLKEQLEKLRNRKKELQEMIRDWGEAIRHKGSNAYYLYEIAKDDIYAIEKKISHIKQTSCDDILHAGTTSNMVSEDVKNFLKIWWQNIQKSRERYEQLKKAVYRGFSYLEWKLKSELAIRSNQLYGWSTEADIKAQHLYEELWESNWGGSHSSELNEINNPLNYYVEVIENIQEPDSEEQVTETNVQADDILGELVFSEEGEFVGVKEKASGDNADDNEIGELRFTEEGELINEYIDSDLKSNGVNTNYLDPNIENWDLVYELKNNKQELDIAKKVTNYIFDLTESKLAQKAIKTVDDKFLKGQADKFIKYGKVVNEAFGIFSDIVTEEKYGSESISKAKIATKKLAIATAEMAAGQLFGRAKSFSEFVMVVVKETVRAVDGDEAVKNMPDDIYGLYDAFRKMHPESGISNTPSSWTEVVP